jgi:hypothetical protein
MEIKRYPSIYFLMREIRKDLFGVDTNNSTDEISFLFLHRTNFDFSSECKKIDTNTWKKIN